MAPHPPDPLGLLTVAMIATLAVTPALALFVAWRHRRAVERSRLSVVRSAPITVGPVAVAPVPVGAPGHRARPAPVVQLDATYRQDWGGPADGLWRRARRRLHTTVAAYVAAGLAFGLVDGAVWLVADQAELKPRNLLGLAVLFAWPLVPTVLSVLAAPRSTRLAVWIAYALVVPLATLGTGITPAETATLVTVVVAPPAAVLLALSGRRIRALGPFLAVPVLVTTTGLLLSPWTELWAVQLGASSATGSVLAVLAAVALGIGGAAHLGRTARRYARKRAGDQMVTISQWWLFATAWHSVALLPSGIRPALAVWTAHLVFRLVLGVALRLHLRPTDPPRRLLLLRPLDAPRDDDPLMRRLRAHWRHVGTITTIDGPHRASAALEPHEFLDLLRGRPPRRTIATVDDLRSRLVELDEDPDPDGRYRVSELYCSDELRHEAMRRLLLRSDCVLLDLRGLARGNARVAEEITRLAQQAPLGGIVVLVDDATDRYLVRASFDRARTTAEGSAWNGSLRLVRVSGARLDVGPVVEQLAAGSMRRI